jgi:murein DD-endopeptidase MepM/ murein hydrolase activator NlpD
MGRQNREEVPVYSAISGEVVFKGEFVDAGNMIVIANSDNNQTIITRYLHLKTLPKFKIGDKVKQGDYIADMGNTGNSMGTHLHFEYWICPKNYKYQFSDQKKYAVDPLKYCYVYPNQIVNENDKNKVMYLEKITYTVVKGDTLVKIANKYNTTYQKLAYYNNISNPNKIYVGQILNIPNDNEIIYTVVKGDTLTKIATYFNTTVTKIYNDNKQIIGNDPNKIYPGQKLVIH